MSATKGFIIKAQRKVIWIVKDFYLAILGVDASSDAVDLLVDLGTVMVTLLTGTGDGERHTGRMPGTDTSDLTQTLVRLAGQLLGVPTAGHSLETLTLGDGNAIDHLVLSEHIGHRHGLLQVLLDPVDLILDGSTVQLDLDDVGLLLTLLDQTDLLEEETKEEN